MRSFFVYCTYHFSIKATTKKATCVHTHFFPTFQMIGFVVQNYYIFSLIIVIIFLAMNN